MRFSRYIWVTYSHPVGLSGLEPPTSRLSGVRSNQLSYKPFLIRQPPAFPCRLQHSIIGRFGLNRRVRDGYGCVPEAHRHRKHGALNECKALPPHEFSAKAVRCNLVKASSLLRRLNLVRSDYLFPISALPNSRLITQQ